MKALWSMLSFMAVVNLLALGMFVAWLWQSGRLDRTRLEQVRELFATTVAEAEGEAAARAAEQERAAAERIDEQRRLDPAPPSAEQAMQIRRVADQEQLVERRLLEQRDLLLAQVTAEAERVQQELRDLEAQRLALQQQIDEQAERSGDAQLAKAVAQLAALPAKQGKAIITELVDRGEIEQAVIYLDAMPQRAAAKLLAAFKDDGETALATELLERLRTYGVEGDVAEAPGDDASPVAAQ